jgi:preprotein translocase subunit SecA
MATSLDEKVQFGGRYDDDGKPFTAHAFGIVDEVDNILIDEARTPLIISGAPEQAGDLYAKFAKLAPRCSRARSPRDWTRGRRRTSSRTTTTSTTRSTRRWPSRARRREGERFLGIDHLYRAENGNLVNHLIQSLKAESLYKRDVDYAVVDGEVKIIDEFTGRILDGPAAGRGLHQAVEAKEGVRVQEENQTLATITLQNYFRMYEKLAGMTGTPSPRPPSS